MSIRRSSLICVAYLQVYERVADNRWWPDIGGLLYVIAISRLVEFFSRTKYIIIPNKENTL